MNGRETLHSSLPRDGLCASCGEALTDKEKSLEGVGGSGVRCDKCVYRIEADESARDYEALEADAILMLRALTAIAERRPNMPFDPWAAGVAQDALWNISDRVKGLRCW